MVHGAAPIFAQEKKDKIRMRPLVDLTARNEITIKDDETSAKKISLHVYDTLLPEGSGMVSDPYTSCPS